MSRHKRQGQKQKRRTRGRQHQRRTKDAETRYGSDPNHRWSGGRKTSTPTFQGDSAERAAGSAADRVVAWVGENAPSMTRTDNCALCEMAQADHCPGCHERLIECRGIAPNCVLICLCTFCGMAIPGEDECPCVAAM